MTLKLSDVKSPNAPEAKTAVASGGAVNEIGLAPTESQVLVNPSLDVYSVLKVIAWGTISWNGSDWIGSEQAGTQGKTTPRITAA